MSKPLVMLSALVAAGLLAVAGGLYFGPDQTVVDVRFNQGRATSQIFAPPASAKEKRIVRYPNLDGSAVDEVLMRDNSTKHIVYDQHMTLRQVFAYFPGPNPEVQGQRMYEKEHDPSGHLFAEQHWRKDGSLEMDGHYQPNMFYLRHVYFPGSSANAQDLVVSSELLFDKLWKPVSDTDFRPDKTRQLAHRWDKDGTQRISDFLADGKTMDWQEVLKDGKYVKSVYLADGTTVAYDITNSYAGTIYQWYSADAAHTPGLKVYFDNEEYDEIFIPSQGDRPAIKQVWHQDYSAKPVDGQLPRVIDHIDVLDAVGKAVIRYDFALDGTLNSVTCYLGPEIYDARVLYTVGTKDGWATKVETYQDVTKSDGGKTLTHENGKQFVVAPWMVTRPAYELPKLKDGLKLYGERPQQGPY